MKWKTTLNSRLVAEKRKYIVVQTNIDYTAFSLMPDDIKFPHAIAPSQGRCRRKLFAEERILAAYGSETHHAEIRQQIAIEFSEHIDCKLNAD